MNMAKHEGGCHCGAIRFEADLDLTAPSYRCNCSICTKTRTWLMFTPRAGFHVLSGEAVMSRYRFGQERIAHCFCAVCGVKTHGETPDGVAVMVAALDLSPEVFAGLELIWFDGANDKFGEPPAITSYL
ncbi:MAG: GFA family protein [Fuscovulum sp.]|jgi:hypothetical protein|nr:MAG: GFA family protein [Fuscovulum sp.]